MKMTEIEKLEAQIKCMKMVDGTGLKWWEVVKINGHRVYDRVDFSWDSTAYTFALGVLEGKPVWSVAVLYREDGISAEASTLMNLSSGRWSWAPPKPKTVMVELLVADAVEFAARVDHLSGLTPVKGNSRNIAKAFREALRKAGL